VPSARAPSWRLRRGGGFASFQFLRPAAPGVRGQCGRARGVARVGVSTGDFERGRLASAQSGSGVYAAETSLGCVKLWRRMRAALAPIAL
jgi:hypothetical protein